MNSDINQSIKISIITVCRNSAATIAKTIESVLDHKNATLEYIIIDGGSTDGTQDIVKSYSGIDHFVSEPDQGIADAFNKGIRLAIGEIIGLINADDTLLPESLDTVMQFFLQYESIDVLHGDLLLYDGERIVKRLKPSGRWWYPWRLVLFNHPATFVRRSIYQRYGLFDTSFHIAMDVEIFLRWQTKGVRICYLPEILANMQIGGASEQNALTGYREVRKAVLQHGLSPLLAHLQLMGKMTIWRLLQLRCKVVGSNQSDNYKW